MSDELAAGMPGVTDGLWQSSWLPILRMLHPTDWAVDTTTADARVVVHTWDTEPHERTVRLKPLDTVLADLANLVSCGPAPVFADGKVHRQHDPLPEHLRTLASLSGL